MREGELKEQLDAATAEVKATGQIRGPAWNRLVDALDAVRRENAGRPDVDQVLVFLYVMGGAVRGPVLVQLLDWPPERVAAAARQARALGYASQTSPGSAGNPSPN